MDSYNSPTTKSIFRGTQITWYPLSLLEVLLSFRFVLKLVGANAEASFTSIIYSLTWPFTVPFLSVFPKTTMLGSILEWTTLLAMLVYWMIAIAIIRLLVLSKTVSTPEAAAKLDEQAKI